METEHESQGKRTQNPPLRGEELMVNGTPDTVYQTLRTPSSFTGAPRPTRTVKLLSAGLRNSPGPLVVGPWDSNILGLPQPGTAPFRFSRVPGRSRNVSSEGDSPGLDETYFFTSGSTRYLPAGRHGSGGRPHGEMLRRWMGCESCWARTLFRRYSLVCRAPATDRKKYGQPPVSRVVDVRWRKPQ